MAEFVIERFTGLDQRVCETLTAPGSSHDELNMCTDGGRLTVTKGFSRAYQQAVPGSSAVVGAAVYSKNGVCPAAAVTGAGVYVNVNGTWSAARANDAVLTNVHASFVQAKIGDTDYLLIADGIHQILKFNGETASGFGSEQGCSDIACVYIAMYRGRLFAAGDGGHPNRLYYSQLPGDGRSIEDWGYYPASPLVEGGHADVGPEDGDPITGIFALSNQLIIIKRYSVYRLIGDRPSNFTIERVGGGEENPLPAAAAVCGDSLYYATKRGLYCFNGVEAVPAADFEAISGLMKNASLTGASMAAVGQRVYLLLSVSGEKRLVEYDILKRRYLLFGGFEASYIFESRGKLMLVSGSRRICEWGSGTTFEGQPIEAHWQTPETWLGDRASVKTLRRLYLYGSGGAVIETKTGGVAEKKLVFVKGEPAEVPLKNEGRSVSIRISNVNGGQLTLEGGLQLSLGVRKRTD